MNESMRCREGDGSCDLLETNDRAMYRGRSSLLRYCMMLLSMSETGVAKEAGCGDEVGEGQEGQAFCG